MIIKLKDLIKENISKIEVPQEPGTVPIPPNHLRLYHYTLADPEVLKREGLRLSHARGHTYGEPDVIWASLQMPGDYKTFIEFSLAIDDPRFCRPSKPDIYAGVDFYKGRLTDFTMGGDIKPSEFIAVHEPWHHTYRYLVENDMVNDVLNGKYDDLLDSKRYPNESKAIIAIKNNFGK